MFGVEAVDDGLRYTQQAPSPADAVPILTRKVVVGAPAGASRPENDSQKQGLDFGSNCETSKLLGVWPLGVFKQAV